MLYAQAAQSGMSTLHLLGGGDNAATIAAYNEQYNAQYKKYAALDAKNTAEKNISAINQDKILSNIAIQMNQQEAEAAAQVSAAVAGVEGSSVDAGLYAIDANAAMQKQQAVAKAEQATEQQLSNVNSAQTDYNSVPQINAPSAFEGMLTGAAQAFGSLTDEDFAGMEAQLDTWSKDKPTIPQYDPRTNNGQWSR
jgi:hypothetical protein